MFRLNKFILLFVTIVLVSISCSQNSKSGPVEIKWDRDACDYCRMAVSDKHFAAQIKTIETAKVTKFDDIGCAIEWMYVNQIQNNQVNIWVMDHHQSTWLNAKKAYYDVGMISPMNFGYGAVAESNDKTLNFEQITKKIITKRKEYLKK